MRGQFSNYSQASFESLNFLKSISADLPSEVKNMIIESSAKLIFRFHFTNKDSFIENYVGKIGILYYQYRDDAIIDWATSYITEYFMIEDGSFGSGRTFGSDYTLVREMCNHIKMAIDSARK